MNTLLKTTFVLIVQPKNVEQAKPLNLDDM